MQGSCTEPAPLVHGDPPLGQLHSGQCLVQVSSGFVGWLSTAAPDVWIHNLYIRSPLHYESASEQHHTLLQWRPLPPAALWVTNTTLEGGTVGLLASRASAYVQGEELAARPHVMLLLRLAKCMTTRGKHWAAVHSLGSLF